MLVLIDKLRNFINQLPIFIRKLLILIWKLLDLVCELQVILKGVHVAVGDGPFAFDKQFDGVAGNLELAVDQLLVTSMLVALLQLEMERDFYQIFRRCEFWRLLKVADFVILVDLLKVYQWHSLVCVDIHKEYFVAVDCCCDSEGEIEEIEAMG